jgi:hypothetical protein
MAVPSAPVPLLQQYDQTTAISIAVTTKAVDLGNGKGAQGAAATATYVFPAPGANPVSGRLRELLELLDEAQRDGEASVS